MRSFHRRRKSRMRIAGIGVVVIAAAAGGWWYLRARGPKAAPDAAVAAAKPDPARPPASVDARKAVNPKPKVEPARPKPTAGDFRLASDEQPAPPPGTASRPASQPVSQPTSRPATPTTASALSIAKAPPAVPDDPLTTRATSDTRTGNSAVEEGRRLYTAGKVLEARERLNNLLKTKLSDAEESEVRALLTRIADETIFSRNLAAGDPLVESYAIQTGDRLVNVAPKYNVPYEIIMAVNGIADAGKIREGQRVKIPRGPFHARIHKSKFRLDVYLGDLYVRTYRVGLGTENGTPEGVWKVKNRLTNPTYYPPASAANKRIIAPDDPNNPLGEHWIGLEGVEGDARGHEGYGIHGTIDPESIGKAVSLGCIRMHNEDVAFLYKLLTPGRSTVTIVP